MANFIPWLGADATNGMQTNYSSNGFSSGGYITALSTNASLRMPSLIAGAVADLFHLNDNTNLSIDSSVADVLAYMQNANTHIKLGGLTVDHYRSKIPTFSGKLSTDGSNTFGNGYLEFIGNELRRDCAYKVTIKIASNDWYSGEVAEIRPAYITTILYIDNESKDPSSASSTLVYQGLLEGDGETGGLYLCAYVTDPLVVGGSSSGFIYFKYGVSTNMNPKIATTFTSSVQHTFKSATLYITELFPITAP